MSAAERGAGVLAGLFDLRGRVAIVTGGSRGLGLQIATALGEFGAMVVLVARKQAELDAAVAELNAQGLSAVGLAADLARRTRPRTWPSGCSSASAGSISS